MDKGLKELKNVLEEKIKVIDKRIEKRNGPCYFDETKKVENLHSEAYAYEKVIKMIYELSY